MESNCSCWSSYPNPAHKRKNGKWKCVDYMTCIQDHKDHFGKAYGAKTHCVFKLGYGPRGRKLSECEWMCQLMCGDNEEG